MSVIELVTIESLMELGTEAELKEEIEKMCIRDRSRRKERAHGSKMDKTAATGH